MKGIYQYKDLKNGDIVYIGKDSNIDNNECRAKTHMRPSHYDDQPFNRALQNNHERYSHEIIYAGDYSEDLLNALEIITIAEFKLLNNGNRPKFNFTDGGDGSTGYKHTKEAKEKISKNNAKYWEGKERSEETRNKISKKLTGNKPWNTGKKRPELSKEKHPNWKNYARITKGGFNSSGKQVFKISYNGNKRIKTSVNKESLKKWFNENYPNVKLIDETKEENNND